MTIRLALCVMAMPIVIMLILAGMVVFNLS